jgi:uracil-DNA glycosylase family 4
MHYRTEQYAQRVRKSGQEVRFNCTYSECPRFDTCAQIPSHGVLFAQKAQLIFVMDAANQDEAEARLPAIHPAGRLLREAMLAHVLIKKKVPFLITKLFRDRVEEGKQPRLFEGKLCFSHFLRDLRANTPKLVVALGMSVFNSLYANATNKGNLPPKSEHNIASIRGKFFTFTFEEDISVRVFVAHNPGAVLQTPALYKLFKDDAHTIATFFTSGESPNKVGLEVKKIEALETVKDVFDYLDFLRYGKKASLVAFDTETRNLNRRHNNAFLTWQFCHEEGVAVAFPIDHKEKPLFADPTTKRQLAERMSGLMNATSADTGINFLIGHNIKFDLSVLWGLMRVTPRDPRVNIPWWCTMLAAHWLDENRKGLAGFLSGSPFSLKTFGVEYFNFYFEEEALDRRGDGALEDLSLKQLYTYGGSDVILTRALAIHQVSKVAVAEPDNAASKLKKFVKYYHFPCSRALAVMECNGIYVKKDQLSYLQGEDSPVWNRMDEIDHKLQELPDVMEFRTTYKDKIGGKLKNASTFEAPLWDMPEEALPLLDLNKQDQQNLFFLDYLRLTPIKMSRKTGKPSLNARFLSHYANSNVYKETPTIKARFYPYYGVEVGKDEKDESPLYNENPLGLTLEYRKLKKLGTAYLDAIEGYLRDPKGDCTDSRVRASYNAHGTDSGRLCVPGDTKILVVTDGNEAEIKGKPIVDVKAGDLVYCYDDELNLRIRKVVWSGKTGTKQVVRLHWKTGTKRKGHLDLTPDHKVRLIDGSYRAAASLLPGDRMLSVSRSPYEAAYYGICYHEVVCIEVLPGEVDVYDLEVEEFHNFIANEICVHNSSNSPNLQQLPGRGKVAKAVKNMFQAEPPSVRFPNGTILLQCDYKTAEVRWAALFAKDTNLIKVFQDSTRLIQEALVNDSVSDEDFKAANLLADLHRRTASLMFNMPADKVSDTQRQSAKTITFALLFGMSVKSLAENNGWTLEEGEEKLRKYFSAFPDLEAFLKRIPLVAKEKGYVETFMGRRRRLANFLEMGRLADSYKHLSEGERKAMNASIQGQSSDAGMIGMFSFMQYIFDNNLEDRWLIQNVVHDSCLVQVPWEDAKAALDVMSKYFVKEMQRYIEVNWQCELAVDIEIEFEIGLQYGALEKWDGRKKTLDKILLKLEKDKESVWKKVEQAPKPPKSLGLVTLMHK